MTSNSLDDLKEKKQGIVIKTENLIPGRASDLWKVLDNWNTSYNSLSDSVAVSGYRLAFT